MSSNKNKSCNDGIKVWGKKVVKATDTLASCSSNSNSKKLKEDNIVLVSNSKNDNTLTIHNSKSELLVSITHNGTVNLSEKYNANEVAEIFWTSLGLTSPMKLQQEVKDLKITIGKLKTYCTYCKENKGSGSINSIKFWWEESSNKKIKEQLGVTPTETKRCDCPDCRNDIGTCVETLPVSSNISTLKYIKYFKEKLSKATKVNDEHLIGKLEKQIDILKDTTKDTNTKRAFHVGDSITTTNGTPAVWNGSYWVPFKEKSSDDVQKEIELDAHDPDYINKRAFEEAMKVIT